MLMVFFKNIIVQGKCAILGPKMAHSYNSGLALRTFFKFCTIKRANSAWMLY